MGYCSDTPCISYENFPLHLSENCPALTVMQTNGYANCYYVCVPHDLTEKENEPFLKEQSEAMEMDCLQQCGAKQLLEKIK